LNTQEEGSGTGLGTLCGSATTALPSRCYSGQHKAADQEDDLGTPRREIWRKKCGQQVSDTAGGRWSRKHTKELEKSQVKQSPTAEGIIHQQTFCVYICVGISVRVRFSKFPNKIQDRLTKISGSLVGTLEKWTFGLLYISRS